VGNGKSGLEGLAAVLKDSFAVFSGRTVLLTGHTGFKGSWLALWLRLLGANVVGYALDPEDENGNFVSSRVGGDMTDLRGDIRDQAKLNAVFSAHAPEIVFHLAARTLVREGYQEPKQTFDVNVGGTVNVLEACRLSPAVRVLVNVTSDKCYLNKGKAAPYRECDRLGGFDPYSASKACAEIVSRAYEHSFFVAGNDGKTRLGLATVRAGNVIGGGDWSTDRIVPDCLRALQARQAIMIRNPRHTRPWQFVLEPLAGYLALAARLHAAPATYSGAWNFGPDAASTVPVEQLVEKIIRAYGRGSWQTEAQTGQPLEARALALDASKAGKKLGWRPVLDLEATVRMTVDWYKQSETSRDMGDFSRRQIGKYTAAMGGS
jgi:CDP-glucose 4,6-dehydratase